MTQDTHYTVDMDHLRDVLTPASTDFVFDAFARRHLTEWFKAGHAPYDWDREMLADFAVWMEINAADFLESSSWSTMARCFDAERAS